MPDAVTHPSLQELSDFGLGRLPADTAATIAGHLETCSTCRKAVAELPPDSFVGKVRAAQPNPASVPGSRSAARAGAANPPETTVAPPEGLPLELASYPKYRFLRELGRGGMGVVYQAEQTLMGRRVAVKVINPGVLAHPSALPRFHAEVRAAAKLDHPNIVRAYDAEQVGGLHLLVMEFVEGANLADLVQRKGPLPVAHACHFIRQAALGLQHAFEQGMVHRDIKPQNLMVTPKGQVKVLDFGLARLRSGSRGLTEMGSFMGTPEYVSPEQATDAHTADTRADLYSLGCTLYFLLTGRPPFPEDTVVKIILAHIEKEAPPMHELRPDVPAALSAVVARLLAKDPARRYQTPVELAQALAPFSKPGARPSEPGAAAPRPAMASPRTGTVLGSDTSKMPEPRQEVVAKAPVQEAPTGARSENLVGPIIQPNETKPKPKTEARPAAWYRRRSVLVGVAGAVLMLALAGLWTAGVLKVKTPHGTIELEGVPAGAEVQVEGPTVTVKQNGQAVTVTAVSEGPYRLKVVQGGQEIWSSGEVLVKVGGDPIRLKVEPTTTGQPVMVDLHRLGYQQDDFGVWRRHGDELWQESTGYPAHLVFGDANWTDYDFSAEAMKVYGSDGLNLLFRVADSRNFWRICYGSRGDKHRTLLHRQIDGRFHAVQDHDEMIVQPGEWYQLRVEVRGPEIKVFCNGGLVYVHTDATHPKGAVGLATYGTVARFRNVKVTDPQGKVLWEGWPEPIWNLAGEKTTRVSVADGVLTAYNPGGPGQVDHLVSSRSDYENYRMRLQVMWTENLDKGASVMARVDRSPVLWGGMRGYQVDVRGLVREGDKSPVGVTALGLGARARTGYELATANHDVLPLDAWHDVEVTVIGNHIQVLMNGKKVVDHQDEGRTFLRGAVALLFGPGTNCRYRNIEIQELPPEPGRATDPRTRWVNQVIADDARNEQWGMIQHTGGSQWLESVTRHPNFQRYRFTEVARTAEYVELERPDGQQKLVVRLRPTHWETGTARTALEPGVAGKWEAEDLGPRTRVGDEQPVPTTDGFVPLFNGRDLSGWHVENGEVTPWTVRQGAIVAHGHSGKTANYLLTDREYTDFIVRLEFRLDKGGGSGIGLRAKPLEKVPSEGTTILEHPQISLADSGKEQTGMTHWLRDATWVEPDQPAALKPAGEWNQLEAEVQGSTLRLVVNGQLVVKTTLAPDARFPDGTVPGLNRRRGRIGLQRHTGTVQFRNIAVKDLSAAGTGGLPKELGAAGSKADYDALATGRWVPILTGPGEKVVSRNAAFKAGVLEMRDGSAIDRSVQAKDMIVRAKVKKLAGRDVTLWMRHNPPDRIDGSRYAALFFGNDQLSVGKTDGKKWTNLQQQTLPEPGRVKEGEFFEFAFAVVGDTLTVYINGKRILEARDPTALPGPGVPGVAAHWCLGLFKDIEVQILDPAAKPVPAADTGFRPLFNGKDLTGWSVDRLDLTGWAVESGAIVARGNGPKTGNFLLTDRDYADFVLRLDFAFENKVGSGIALRATPGEWVPWPNGRSRQNHPQLALGGDPPEETGATAWMCDASVTKPERPAEMRPAGEWNQLEIELQGRTLRARVNGKAILSTRLAADARFPDGGIPGLNRAKGRIGFQKHTGTVRFRNIAIKELTQAEPGGSATRR